MSDTGSPTNTNSGQKTVWSDIGNKVVVGVITAVVLGALALAWNFMSGGGLIRALGGIPATDLNPEMTRLTQEIDGLKQRPTALTGDQIKALIAANLPTTVSAEIPAGAVMAFDRTEGCPKKGWEPMPKSWIGRVFVVASDNALHKYAYRNGQELAAGSVKYLITEGGHGTQTHDAGKGAAHNNMPPYMPLFFCKKLSGVE